MSSWYRPPACNSCCLLTRYITINVTMVTRAARVNRAARVTVIGEYWFSGPGRRAKKKNGRSIKFLSAIKIYPSYHERGDSWLFDFFRIFFSSSFAFFSHLIQPFCQHAAHIFCFKIDIHQIRKVSLIFPGIEKKFEGLDEPMFRARIMKRPCSTKKRLYERTMLYWHS